METAVSVLSKRERLTLMRLLKKLGKARGRNSQKSGARGKAHDVCEMMMGGPSTSKRRFSRTLGNELQFAGLKGKRLPAPSSRRSRISRMIFFCGGNASPLY